MLAEADPGDSRRIFIIWLTEDLTFVFAILLVYWVMARGISFIGCAGCTLCAASTTPLLLLVLSIVLNADDADLFGDFLALILNFSAQVIVAFGAAKGTMHCKARIHQSGGHDAATLDQQPEVPLHPIAPLATTATIGNSSVGRGDKNPETFGNSFGNSTISEADFRQQLNWKSSFAIS